MRKSDKIILSVVLLTAIVHAKAEAQNLIRPQSNALQDTAMRPRILAQTTDTSSRGSHSSSTYHSNWFRRVFHHNTPPGSSHTGTRPRTGGFGTTIRPTLRIAGS